jgi:hypothetical protein
MINDTLKNIDLAYLGLVRVLTNQQSMGIKIRFGVY